ncbi:MAG: Crossover junction endodeoxyribonuclease RuvC [Thermoanaerobacterales bacterium 50_218]|nr:MAG: Crossover junction endodeoxyribonuclease RuvC [Thermoanaerobacterales bacterium 50_218]HAA89423.1 crossover junction endodeoxyribonuclease RuvC [Peptococcaceae bacterium]
MVIMGIDPGVVTTGYGILRVDVHEVSVVTYGTIKIDRDRDLPSRLLEVHQELEKICSLYRPAVLALEEIFFSRNRRTALLVGHVRGAIILAAAQKGLSIVTYTPLQIKQAITGYGRAEKEQVQKMLKLILKLPEVPEPDHAADALAAALCHYYNSRGHAWGRIWRGSR